MKQAREAGGGASRREVEKTCGRNAAGVGIPAIPRKRVPRKRIVDAAGDVAMRGEIPGRSGRLSWFGTRVSRWTGTDRERRRRNSEEDGGHEGMNPIRKGRGTVGREADVEGGNAPWRGAAGNQ